VTAVQAVLVSEHGGAVASEAPQLGLADSRPLDEVPAPDLVLVPGGPGQVDQMADGPLHA
jgi:putative intracellular protease/amidase